MSSENYKEMLSDLSGKSGAVITEKLSGIFGEDGMINNLMKMVVDLENEKKSSNQTSLIQGIGIGASIATVVCAGVTTGCLLINNRKKKAEEKKKEEERQKQLEKYHKELEMIDVDKTK